MWSFTVPAAIVIMMIVLSYVVFFTSVFL